MAQDEEKQSKHGSDSITVEVSDLQQQSGVFLAHLAAPMDDRCLVLSAFSQCTVNSMQLGLHHAASECSSPARSLVKGPLYIWCIISPYCLNQPSLQ